MFDPHSLPAINASLNAFAGCFLLLGWLAIKGGRRDLHQVWMSCAMAASMLFLCSYLTYHFMVPGVTRYQGAGFLRILYFSILLTHTPLAVVVVPASIMAVKYALQGNFQKHVGITKWLYPVWVYVSLTGVIIYLMLYVF